MHVFDLAKILDYFIEHEPKYKDYNLSSGETYLLSEIANIVKDEMKSELDIKILSSGLNNEYTASNERLINECKIDFIKLREGIRKQIVSEKEKNCEKKNS